MLNGKATGSPLPPTRTRADWTRHNWGIDAVALDPQDPNKVYAAVGLYTNSWDPDNGSVIRSSDRGATWAFANLPFKVGGNMPGRGLGERLAVGSAQLEHPLLRCQEREWLMEKYRWRCELQQGILLRTRRHLRPRPDRHERSELGQNRSDLCDIRLDFRNQERCDFAYLRRDCR